MKNSHSVPFKYCKLACLVALFCHAGVYAQEQDSQQTEAEEQEAERITITGSRIKRADFTMPMPLLSFDKADIDALGTNSIDEALLEIPGIEAGFGATDGTTNVQNSGLRTVDLRGLGENRTLVLIDGRRTVSNSANGNRVSQGTLPASLIQRVEVITGGASAIYGSDAVAGVVNIITENDQVGWEVEVRGGRSNSYSFSDQTYDVSYGSEFDDGKGYLFAALNYDRETGVKAAEVPRTLVQADWQYDDGINTFVNKLGDRIPVGQITPDEFGNLSADPDGGRFDGSNFWYNEQGLQEGFVTDRDGFDFRIDDDLRAPRERLNLALKGRYDFNDELQGFFTVIYSDNKTHNQREPEGDDYNDVHLVVDPITFEAVNFPAGRIPIDNPFAPQIIIDNESSRGIRWDRRFVEVGNQLTENDRETIRAWTGLRGEVFDDWEWEVSLGYGEFNQEQTRFNEINIIHLNQGLNAEELADGTIQCADADARAAGCVPVNLFGRGSITPEAADWIRANLTQDAEVKQLNLNAFMTGELFEMPAGYVGAAFGVEYRKDEQNLMPDELTQRGGHSSITVPAFTGDYDVTEAFAEFSFPLLADLPAAHSLTADASVRVADYSIDHVGTVVSFGTGIQYLPIPDLNLRASFNRALRAPDLTELFSPPRGDSDSFDDICDGVTLETTGTIAENCRSDAGILSTIMAEGVFEQESSSHSSPNAGNLDLKEEEADTVTVGVVWQPEFLEGFSFAADYYRVEITDAIDAFSNEDILRQCYEDANTFGDQNRFCTNIFRNPEDGQLTNVIQRQENLNSQETSGVDYNVAYEFDIDGIPGTFDLRYIHTHLIKYEEVFDGLDGIIVDDQKGELVHEKFEDRGRFSIAWEHDNWRLFWRTLYYGSAFDSKELRETYEEAIEEFGDAAEEPLYLNIDSVMLHNLSVRYDMEYNDIDMRFSVGVNNVFDDEGPFIPAGDAAAGGSRNFDNAYGLLGRYGWARVNLRF